MRKRIGLFVVASAGLLYLAPVMADKLSVTSHSNLVDKGGNHIAPPGTRQALLVPPCDLLALNEEYLRILSAHRRDANKTALKVRFNRNLFYGAVLFNRALQLEDSLHHDPDVKYWELCGTVEGADYRNAAQALAQRIWSALDHSSRHQEIQSDGSLVQVAVSCTQGYYVVRLNTDPVPLNKKEYYLFNRITSHATTSW